MSNVLVPKITIEQTRAFSKVWDSGGIKIILDETSLRFATDWTNIVLKSFIEDQVKKAMALQKVMQEKVAALTEPTNAVATQTVPPSPPQKSSIILTD